jgi:hypothetical protein
VSDVAKSYLLSKYRRDPHRPLYVDLRRRSNVSNAQKAVIPGSHGGRVTDPKASLKFGPMNGPEAQESSL